MRLTAAIAALVAFALAPAAALAASSGTQSSRAAICKKKAKKKRGLTKAERRRYVRRCMRRRPAAPAPEPQVTTPGPLVDPPAVPPPGDAPPADGGTAGPPPPTVPLARLGVTAREFSLVLSRTQMTAGPALVELAKFGEDPHNLTIEPTAGGTEFEFPETAAGERTKQTVTLAAGTYRLTCTLPGHEAAGMKATLSVGG